jgi:hypothetical protein
MHCALIFACTVVNYAAIRIGIRIRPYTKYLHPLDLTIFQNKKFEKIPVTIDLKKMKS